MLNKLYSEFGITVGPVTGTAGIVTQSLAAESQPYGSAPDYLASDLQRISHLNASRRLRCSTTSALVAPRTVRATIGDRTFPVAAASLWNSLPESVRVSPSLQVFCSRLKTKLFARSYSCSD